MNERSRRAWLACLVLGAFLLDAVLGSLVDAHGARPSFALTTLLVGCLFVGPNSGAVLGLLTGILQASYTPIYVGSFLVSRSLAGWVVGSLEAFIFRESVVIAFVTSGMASLAAEGLFFVFAPHSHAGHWASRTALEGAYDAFLAIPIYYIVARIARRRD